MLPLRNLFSRLSFCAKIGALVGPIIGAVFVQILSDFPNISTIDILIIIAALGVSAWLFCLLVAGVILSYGVRQIALITLATSLLTSIGVSAFLYYVSVTALSLIVGLILGIVIGELVCRTCTLLMMRAERGYYD